MRGWIHMKKILVVDDDADIVRLISDSLSLEHFEVETAFSGREAIQKIERMQIDFLILDIMMPEMDGLEVCRRIRPHYHMPILFLSAKSQDFDKVIGLEVGGDDYMTKPFSVYELLSRVKAHFRRMDRLVESLKQAELPTVSPLSLNEQTYEVWMYGKKMDFSTREFQILLYLTQHPNQVLTRDQIYENVWGFDYGDINTVTVHIKNIRKKLGLENEFIKTIWGVGYKFVPEITNR